MSTSLKRVTSIPLIHDSLSNIHDSLINNVLTRSPYNLSLAITERALNLSQPFQHGLAPVINTADSLANKGLDVVQSRYPYPFETPSQDIYRDIKAYPDHAVHVAQKKATDVASDIDQVRPLILYLPIRLIEAVQRLTPLVNSYESVIARMSSAGTRSPTDSDSEDSLSTTARSQVERAYNLTLDLRDQVYSLSSEQLAHHQTLAAVV